MGKLGLVLCGGVAKGAYEVGVLKAMAEIGLTPDAIVGISAGALNGAMAASAIADERFTPAYVAELEETWRERVTLHNFYHCYDGDDNPNALERKSLNNLLLRFGIDPFSKSFLPTKLDPGLIKLVERILRGDFISIFSHAYFRQLAHQLQFPHTVSRPIKFSAALCNLMGETSLDPASEQLATRWIHYEDFQWYPRMSRTESFIQANRLVDVVMGSASFPIAFSPMRLTVKGAARAGLFIDGGITDSAPIGKCIALDPEIDTVVVVMSTTIVAPMEEEPQNIFQVINRFAQILAGKFVITNYHKVLRVNRRLAALGRVLEKDADGRPKDSAFNESLCVAAGFGSLADYRRRRIVRIIPVCPSEPLKGDLFDGFVDQNLTRAYIDQGYQDATITLSERFGAPSPPDEPDPVFGSLHAG